MLARHAKPRPKEQYDLAHQFHLLASVSSHSVDIVMLVIRRYHGLHVARDYQRCNTCSPWQCTCPCTKCLLLSSWRNIPGKACDRTGDSGSTWVRWRSIPWGTPGMTTIASCIRSSISGEGLYRSLVGSCKSIMTAIQSRQCSIMKEIYTG